MKTRLFADEIDLARRDTREERRRAFWKIVEKTFLPFFFFITCPSVFGWVLNETACRFPEGDDLARVHALNLAECAHVFHLLHHRYPKTLSELIQPSKHGPIMEHLPRDPWGNEYRYVLRLGTQRDLTLVSKGADGTLRTEDDVSVRVKLRPQDEPPDTF